MRAALAVLLLALSAPAQEPLPEKKTDNSQGNVKFLVPNVRTWTKAMSKDGWTWYYVWLNEPDFCHLKIWDGAKLEGDFRKAFDAEVQKFVALHGTLKATNGVKESPTREGIPALQQTLEITAKHGTVYAWFVGFQPKDRFELLAYTAGTEATWLKHAEDAKTFMTNILFANMPDPAKAGGAAGPYKEGDKVDILFGGQWYPGEVLEAGDGKWKVHYDGYGANWDSWVEADRLRRREAAVPDPLGVGEAEPGVERPGATEGGDPRVGEVAEAAWNNSWYEVDIVAVAEGKFQVRWRGYGDKTEWLPRDQIRRKGDDKEILPPKAEQGDGGGAAPERMVGKAVEVWWRGSWWPAKVAKTDGKRLFVEYDNPQHGSTASEWVSPSRVRAPGAEAKRTVDPATVPGAKGLSGLWWKAEYHGHYEQKAGTKQGHTIRVHYFFFEDGRVMRRTLPAVPAEADYAAYQEEHPRSAGAYGIEGGKIRFVWGGDSPAAAPADFKVVDENRMDVNGVPLFRARSFPDGETLSGTYRGHIEMSDLKLTFREDGTYEFLEVITISEQTQKDGSHATREIRRAGRYRLSGQVMALTDEQGNVHRELAWPAWEPGEPRKVIAMIRCDLILQ